MISFNKPYFTEKEFKNVNSSLESRLVSGDQRYTKKCHKFIEETFMTSKALLTTSCSMSLDMASILLDLKEGDEVKVKLVSKERDGKLRLSIKQAKENNSEEK